MHDRRRLFVLLAVAVAAVATVGSGGFSTTTADRSVTVDVVGDANAYMALEYDGTEVNDGDEPTFLTVTNQFTQPVDVTVEYSVTGNVEADPNDGTLGDDEDTDLAIGESVDFSEFTLTCATNETGTRTATVTFDVTAEGTDVFAETTDSRQVTYSVDCQSVQTGSVASVNTTTDESIGTATETATETTAE
ncbi:hypothetical protein [Halorhabdus amylolytica]|uniref:hypothetical protein n=1 Tax=Halorhabdus amylolytica TaxID=2559573 RepID=UPI0010AA9C22|nr:hypothetical protein [Halorhabdus amylolytica]